MDDLKARLLKPRLPEDEVDVPGIGTIRVRGLSRAEAITVKGHQGTDKFEQMVLVFGVVDPALSEDEVSGWLQAASFDELDPVLTKIGQLSGLMDDSAKEVYREFEADPEAEFRVPPGGEAGPDGGGTAGDPVG